MATGDVYKLQAVFTNSDTGKNLSFGLHGRQPGLVAPSIGDVGDAIKDWWNSDLGSGEAQKVQHDADTALALVSLQRINPLEPIVYEYTTGLPIAGTLAGDQYAGQAAILISLRTAKVGRSYRGRAYLPPPGEGVVGSNAALGDTTAENIAQQFALLLPTLVSIGFTPVVWSALLSEANDIVTVYCDRLLRTQRRRQDRATEYKVG